MALAAVVWVAVVVQRPRFHRSDTFHDSYRQPRALETGLRMAPRQESTKSGLVGRTSKLDSPNLVEAPGHT